MKCEFCGTKTDYHTVDDEPICQGCINSKQYIGCTDCGKFYQQEFNNGDGTSCYSCMNKD